MFGHSMFGVFEVRYFGVRSKTNIYIGVKVCEMTIVSLERSSSIVLYCKIFSIWEKRAIKTFSKKNSKIFLKMAFQSFVMKVFIVSDAAVTKTDKSFYVSYILLQYYSRSN